MTPTRGLNYTKFGSTECWWAKTELFPGIRVGIPIAEFCREAIRRWVYKEKPIILPTAKQPKKR